MIVDYLDIVRPVEAPFETNPPLLIYPDAILPFAFAQKCLKPVAWQRCKVPQSRRTIEYLQAPLGLQYKAVKPTDITSFIQRPSVSVAERLDQYRSALSRVLRYVKHNIEYGDRILQFELGFFEDTGGTE
jgi:hypothetical protein